MLFLFVFFWGKLLYNYSAAVASHTYTVGLYSALRNPCQLTTVHIKPNVTPSGFCVNYLKNPFYINVIPSGLEIATKIIIIKNMNINSTSHQYSSLVSEIQSIIIPQKNLKAWDEYHSINGLYSISPILSSIHTPKKPESLRWIPFNKMVSIQYHPYNPAFISQKSLKGWHYYRPKIPSSPIKTPKGWH
jgi:hypothetical protein